MMLLRIKELREMHGISQAKLAEDLHVNQTAISQWERETAYPTCDRLPAIAAVFGVEISDLFGRQPAASA